MKQTITQNLRNNELMTWLFTPRQAWFEKTERSVVFAFLEPAAIFWKRVIISTSERAFQGDFLLLDSLKKRGVFTHKNSLSSFQLVSSKRRVTRSYVSFQTSAWSLLSWHPTYIHLWVRLTVFSKLFACACACACSCITYKLSPSEKYTRYTVLSSWSL